MFEEQMIDQIRNFIEELGFSPYSQIPLFSGKIDFVGVRDDECVIVESKLNNWKSALKQALFYGYGADYSYIALPNNYAKYIFLTFGIELKKHNIGLLSVDLNGDQRLEILIMANKKDFSTVYKNNILYEINKRKTYSENRINDFKRLY
jgi:hypothetical protein